MLVYAFAVLVLPFLGLLAQLLGFHIMLSECLEGKSGGCCYRALFSHTASQHVLYIHFMQ